MSKRIKGITIEIDGNTTKLEKSLADVESATRKVSRSLGDINKLLKFSPKNAELVAQKQQELGKQVQNTKDKLDTLKKADADMKRQLANGSLGQEQYDAFRREIVETESKLKYFREELQKVKNIKLTELGKQFEKVGGKIKAAGEKISQVGGKLTTGLTVPIVGAAGLMTKSAIEFESAFAGVRKTVDASEEQFTKLERGIRDMSKELPTSANGIAAVAEAAGQLGIKTENILDFTRVMIDLGESTNLGSDQAASQLARFANITNMSQKDFDRLGSTIVALGNNFATTEADIVNMSMRLAGAGSQLGLTESEITGLATAMSSVGIEAEMGGSAMSKLLIQMQVAAETGDEANAVLAKTGMSLRELQMLKSHDSEAWGALAEEMNLTKEELNRFVESASSLENFSRVTGLSADEFKKKFGEDAVGALSLFLGRLDDTNLQGKTAIAVLEEMGISEVRLRDTILRTTGASDMLVDAVGMSNKAWEENTALSNEAEQRYATLESRMQTAKNALNDIGITIGEKLMPHVEKAIEKIQELATWFSNLDDETIESGIKIAGVVAALGPLLLVSGKVISVFGTLVSGIGTLITKLSSLSVSLAASGTSLGSVAASALKLLGPIAAVIAIVVDLWRNNEEFRNGVVRIWNDLTSRFQELAQRFNEAGKTIVNLLNKLGFDFENFGEVVSTIWNHIRSFLAPIFIEAFNSITQGFRSATDIIGGILDVFNGIFTGDWSKMWNGVKDIGLGILNALTNTIQRIFGVFASWFKIDTSNLVNSVGAIFEYFKNQTISKFIQIKDGITRPIKQAFEAVRGVVDRIKSLFNFQFKLPRIKLPHFGIKPRGWNIGDLLKGSIPKLGVEWYDKGGIFTGPQIIGVGEKRPEFVGALDDLKAIVAEVINKEGGGSSITNNFNISGLSVRNDDDIERIADALFRRQRQLERGGGIA